MIKEIATSGIKVIIAGSSVSDLALQYLNSHSVVVLKVLSKFELRRLCRVVNATPLNRMGTPTPEEMGWVDVYETVDFDGERVTVLRQLTAGDPGFEKSSKRGDGKGKKTQTATIVLRGATAKNLNDLESAIDDGLNLIRMLLQDRRLVPGAGATEQELAKRVNIYGSKMKGQQRHVVKRFAMALEVIPRTLAENAAVGEREGNKVVNQFEGGNEATEPSEYDIKVIPPSDGTILARANSVPILDSLAVKRCAIKHAVAAAVSVLNIDGIIMGRQGDWWQGNWGVETPLTINYQFENSINFWDNIIAFSIVLIIMIDILNSSFFRTSPFLDNSIPILLTMMLIYVLFRLKSSININVYSYFVRNV